MGKIGDMSPTIIYYLGLSDVSEHEEHLQKYEANGETDDKS
jgi:hypothetical protein